MNSLNESLRDGEPVDAGAAVPLRHLIARLRFRHLQLLVVLHQRGSLHAAAEAMNLTQPSLSKALAEIEAMLGRALFVRGPRGLRATADGVLVIQSAALMLAELQHLHQASLAAPAAMTIRVGMPPFVAHRYMPTVLQQLAQAPIAVRLQLHEGRVPALAQALRAGELDALLSSYTTEIGAAAGELRYEALLDSELVVVAPRDSPLARHRRLPWSALLGERWILPESASMVRRIIDQAFAAAGHLTPEPWVESSNPVTNLRLVAAGQGISAVPSDLLDDAATAASVARLALRTRLARGPVALIHRRAVNNPRVDMLRWALGLPGTAG